MVHIEEKRRDRTLFCPANRLLLPPKGGFAMTIKNKEFV